MNYEIMILTVINLLAVASLIYMSYTDYKVREVSNEFQLFYLALPVIGMITFTYSTEYMVFSLFWGSVLLGLGYLMYRFGDFGGADVKVLAITGLLLGPHTPQFMTYLPLATAALISTHLYAKRYAKRNNIEVGRIDFGDELPKGLMNFASGGIAFVFAIAGAAIPVLLMNIFNI